MIYNGINLKDNKTLKYYNIENNSTIHLILKNQQNDEESILEVNKKDKIRIIVSTLTKKNFF